MYHVNPATTSLLVLLLLAFSRLSASKKKDCSCYQTSLGSNPALTFAHYEFYDFRSIEAKSNDDLSKPPPRIIGSEDTGQEPVTSSYFQSPDFSSAWQIQNWSQGNTSSAPVEMVNSPRNIYILDDSSKSTHLTLRTSRLSSFQSTSELSTTATNLFHASIRVRARLFGPSGVVAGLFLYADAKNETDTELRTRDPLSTVRLTNQPGTDSDGQIIPDASSAVGIPMGVGTHAAMNGSREEWNEYRVDWQQGLTEWVVNNQSVARKEYGVPTVGMHFNINLWSNGGEWSGEVGVGGVATLDVEWVELAYNVTGGDGQGQCEVVCGLDGQAGLGSPRLEGGGGGKLEAGSLGVMMSVVLCWALWMLVANR